MKFLQKQLDGEWVTVLPLTSKEEIDCWSTLLSKSPSAALIWRIIPDNNYRWQEGDQLQLKHKDQWSNIRQISQDQVTSVLQQCHNNPGQYRIVRPIEVFRV